jgi:hypothetical protein
VHYPPLVGKGRVIRHLGVIPKLGLESKLVVDGAAQLLFASEVFFGGLNRHVPEKKLDLIELTAGKMAKAGTRPA